MAALTWKNVDGLQSSAADSYAKFSELLTKAGANFTEGLDTFQNTRKEQAAMSVQQLLQGKNSIDQLKDANAVNGMLQGIPKELLTPEVFAQIEARRTALREQGKYDSDLASQGLRDTYTKSQTDATLDGLENNKLLRQETQQKIDLGAKELANYDANQKATLDKLLADTKAVEAGVDNDAAELGLKRDELGLKRDEYKLTEAKQGFDIEQLKAAASKASTDDAAREKAAAILNAIGTTKDYPAAKALVADSGLPASVQNLLNTAVSARFPELDKQSNQTNYASQVETGSSSNPFRALDKVAVKASNGNTTSLGSLGVSGLENLSKKGGIHFGAGDTKEGTLRAMQLMSNLFGDDPNHRITGTNDDWHKKNSPKSTHNNGDSADYTVSGGKKAYEAAATKSKEALKAQGLEEGKDFEVLDEANFPSSKSTEDHIHVEIKASGQAKLTEAYKKYEEASSTPTQALVDDVRKANQYVGSIVPSAEGYVTALQNAAGMTPIKVKEGADPNDPTSLADAIVTDLGLPKSNIPRYADEIRQSFQQQQSKGNTAVTYNQVASAYKAATAPNSGSVYDRLSDVFPGYLGAGVDSDSVDRLLDRAAKQDNIKAGNLVDSRKQEITAYRESVDTLNTLTAKLQQAELAKSHGADNSSTVEALKSAIKAQVTRTNAAQDKVRAFIEAMGKEEAAKKEQERVSNPASEDYQY